jgi:3-keto-disaccharide hydrolase
MRLILLSAVIFLLAAAVGMAQDKPKEKPKSPPRIAVDDLAKLKDDKDFAIQGDFRGNAGTSKADNQKVGAQVVALGEGKFDVKMYRGGLPGDGWDGKAPEVMKAERKDGHVMLSAKGPDGKPGEVGLIEDGKLMMPIVVEMKKVERKSATLGAEPPKGALVLFAKPGDEANWDKGKLVELSDGKFLNNGIKSKQSFGNFSLHVEFRLPWMPNSRGQGRANSGVYLQDRYEVQVLDSFGLKGLNNECGGIYQQFAPKINMCYPPMVWQTYDVEFTAAEFDGDKKVKPARATVMHNGVVIHDDVELKGPTGGGQPETENPGPIQLQNHGDPVVYRNIWVVEKK